MDDSKLRQDVLDELSWQPHIPAAEITVTADQGTVHLSGYVTTYAQKVAAEQAVKRVVGVRAAVVESLEVKVADEISGADEEIATRARASISWTRSSPAVRCRCTSKADGSRYRVNSTGISSEPPPRP